MNLAARGLILAGLKYPGAKVCGSTVNFVLMRRAAEHAQYQADHQRQGHQNWQRRFEQLRREVGQQYTFAEICAESWEWQENEPMEALGREMFKCWEYSSGHWSVASVKHAMFGAGMAKGGNGIWYACIIVGD